MGTMWNAKSQEAYHGYSHLSGTEIMSLLARCVQSEFLIVLRTSGGDGEAGSPSNHSLTWKR
jgi:hypothetical protein